MVFELLTLVVCKVHRIQKYAFLIGELSDPLIFCELDGFSGRANIANINGFLMGHTLYGAAGATVWLAEE